MSVPPRICSLAWGNWFGQVLNMVFYCLRGSCKRISSLQIRIVLFGVPSLSGSHRDLSDATRVPYRWGHQGTSLTKIHILCVALHRRHVPNGLLRGVDHSGGWLFSSRFQISSPFMCPYIVLYRLSTKVDSGIRTSASMEGRYGRISVISATSQDDGHPRV